LFVFSLEQLVAAERVDGPMLGRGHQPGARVAWHTRVRPLFERCDKSILCEIFGETNVAHDSNETGNESGRFDSPDRVDRAMEIGSRHKLPITLSVFSYQ
jgi:hypothetical protein